MYYPLLLNLRKKHVAIIGAGRVGKRKLFSLLPCRPSSIDLYDPCLEGTLLDALCVEVKEYQTQCIQKESNVTQHIANASFTLKNVEADNSPVSTRTKSTASQSFTSGNSLETTTTAISYHTHEFSLEDSEGIDLLFAATNNRKVNEHLASLCREKKILCNIADEEEESDFIVPAAIRQEGLTISIASNGQSPALTRKIKSDIEQWLGKKYSSLSLLMGRLRPHVLALNNNPDENALLFRSLVNSKLAEHLENKNTEAATAELLALLPKTLHGNIGELLYDI